MLWRHFTAQFGFTCPLSTLGDIRQCFRQHSLPQLSKPQLREHIFKEQCIHYRTVPGTCRISANEHWQFIVAQHLTKTLYTKLTGIYPKGLKGTRLQENISKSKNNSGKIIQIFILMHPPIHFACKWLKILYESYLHTGRIS